MWLRKGNFKRETESLQIAAQNNAIRTNHIKARIDQKKKNNRCRLCGDRDQTINHIMSECTKLGQKEYKTRNIEWGNWSTGICARNWSLTLRTNDNCTTQNLHLENETHKLLWDFETQTVHKIPVRWPDLVIIKKKKWTRRIVEFAVTADHKINLKENEKKDKHRDLARESKKLCNMKVTVIPIVIGALCTVIKDWYKDWSTWKLEDVWRPSKLQQNQDRPEYWEKSWRLEETCCHSNSSERLSINTGVKNSKR